MAAKRKKPETRGRKAKGYTKCNIQMAPESWERLDRLRGRVPRGEFIAGLLAAAEPDGAAGPSLQLSDP